jgi:DNA-binding response OmpR family regulator
MPEEPQALREWALLVEFEGETIRRQWTLGAPVLRIGRQIDNDVVIPDRWTSRYHAEIRRDGTRYYLHDLGAKNGTLLNNLRLTSPVALTDGDQISVAPGHVLTFVDYSATAPLPQQEGQAVILDPATRDVWIRGTKLEPPLSQVQFQFLATLVADAGRAVSRDALICALWPEEDPAGISDDALNALAHRLRTRLRELAPDSELIVSIRGFGFRFRPSGC